MKVSLVSHQLIDLKQNEHPHTEAVRVHDLLPDWMERPECLKGKPGDEVIGYLLYGTTVSVSFMTSKALLPGDLITLPDDPYEYLIHRSSSSQNSNVEIFDIGAECDLSEPRGIRFVDSAVEAWHSNRVLTDLIPVKIPVLQLD